MKTLTNQTIFFGIIALLIYLLFFFDRNIAFYIHNHFSGTLTENIGSGVSVAAYNGFYKLGMAVSFFLIIGFWYRAPRPVWTKYQLSFLRIADKWQTMQILQTQACQISIRRLYQLTQGSTRNKILFSS